LQRHDWELETAVHITLTSRDAPIERWLPVRAQGQGLLGYIISLVYNLISRSFWSAFGIFWRLIRPPDRSECKFHVCIHIYVYIQAILTSVEGLSKERITFSLIQNIAPGF
jgi:hypothetical protein